jgi:hypothetical protein
MPIGPITPGSPVTVTPDVSPTPYASIQAPTATMPILAAHLQFLTLVLLNIQKYSEDRKLDKLDGGTVSGDVAFSGVIDFQATGADRPQFQGGLRVVAGGIAITAGDLGLSSGSVAAALDLTAGRDGLIARHLTVGQALQLNQSVISTDADQHLDGTAPFVRLPPGVFNANHLCIMDAVPAGRFVKIVSWENGYLFTVKQADGTTAILDAQGDAIRLTAAVGAPAAGDHVSVTLYSNGTGWEYAGA